MCKKETTMEYTEHRRKVFLISPDSNYTAFTLLLLQGRVLTGELQYWPSLNILLGLFVAEELLQNQLQLIS